MRYYEPAGGQLVRPEHQQQHRMPIHPGLAMLGGGGYRGDGGGYRGVGGGEHHRPPPPVGLSPMMMHRTSSLEVLNNIKFEEKRALIASTLSLNDLLKSSSDFRAPLSPGSSRAQFAPSHGGYLVPHSLFKNGNGYNVNFLNNGLTEKDLGMLLLFTMYPFYNIGMIGSSSKLESKLKCCVLRTLQWN